MDTNCKNKNINSKYNNIVDHVYCHSNENNYFRANAGSLDAMALLKENKQLKAMLLLHLDLIQEQSDQLLAKDKLLAGLKEENDLLKKQTDLYERNYGCSERNVGRTSKNFNNNNNNNNNNNTISSDLQQVKKIIQSRIEEKKENMRDFKNNVETKNVNTIKSSDSEKKDNINVSKSITTRSKQSPSPPLLVQQQNVCDTQEKKYKIYDENPANSSSIIGQSNGKLISKIILHRVQIPESMTIPKKEINDESIDNSEELEHENVIDLQDFKTKSNKKARSSRLSENSDSNAIKTIPSKSPTIYNDNVEIFNQNELKIKYEDFSHDAQDSNDQKTINNKLINIALQSKLNSVMENKKKCTLLTTRKPYSVREWIDEEIPPEEWSNKEEEEALKAEAPMLEVPKWSIKEFSALYCIEGTEDLSDDIFIKRHAKLEHDEKRRKKWDAQRIREQRTIERLKRRHCKDELQEIENSELISFYSTSDAVKFIQITEELPVQAFGEGIPRLNYGEFHLPWIQRHQQQQNDQTVAGSSSGTQSANQISSFAFLKKRRRQQSLSVNNIKRKGSLTTTTNINTTSIVTESNILTSSLPKTGSKS